MSMVSNLKNLFALTALLFGASSAASNGTAVITSVSRVTPTLVLEPTLTPKSILTPDGAIVIKGLNSGTTVAAATNNTNVLNAALDGGNKNLIIPAGEWYTGHTVYVRENTTLTFEGKLHQLDAAADWEDWSVLRIDSPNVTLNNPHLSQKGRVGGHGTHACLQIYGKYNTGNITINGGILEWGASNNFHGGRNNTVFNSTIFRDSMEHLVYASGIKGNGYGEGRASGLTFNDCIFERPGNGLYKEIEANHIQIRNYKNVEINNCIVKGKKKTLWSQYAILLTGVDGLVVKDTNFTDISYGFLFTGRSEGYETKNVEITRVNASGTTNIHIRKGNGKPEVVTFTDFTIERPYKIAYENKFNNCTFKLTNWYVKVEAGGNSTFNSCTWDYSKSTYSKAFVKESGSTVTFTGIQTKVAPSDGHSLNWGPLQE